MVTEVQLRRAEYPNFRGGMGTVVYARFGESGNQIIFSGVTRHTTSTINAAERIIRAISLQEKIDNPKRIAWFDLQTEHGYPYFLTGEYEFSQLVLAGNAPNIEVVRWIPSEPSRFILQLFAGQLGSNPRPRRL